MNQLPQQTRQALKRMLASGASNRAIQQVLGLSHATVTKYGKAWAMAVTCPCGKPAGHNGWCSYRLAFSPNRRGWLKEHWEARGSSTLAVTVDAALAAANAHGHQIGRFMWGTAFSTTLAYAICSVCGKNVQINRTYARPEYFGGTATEKRCLTKAELAAQKAANEEKRTWHAARRTLRVLRAHLRASRSPTTASAPPPTSCG